MKPVRYMTDAELEYVIQDCLEAISAYPAGGNVPRYLAEKNACKEEQTRRQVKRILRDGSKKAVDPLTLDCRIRKHAWKGSGKARDCAWTLGWYRLHS